MKSSKKILLAGGAGFIGHHLAIHLADAGHDVTVCDGFSVNNMLNLVITPDKFSNLSLFDYILAERIHIMRSKGVKIRVGDLSDRYQVAKLFTEKYDVVYLLAAVSHASRSNSSPADAIVNGLVPFSNFLAEAVNNPATRLVYMSSSTVYGNFTKEIVDETDICRPFGMYALLKYQAERLLIETSLNSKINFSVARPSALYGERCISRRVSQIFLENSISGVPLVFRGDINEKLDFTYIKDLVSGLSLLGLHKNAKNEIFNLTYGDAKPVVYLAEILKGHFPSVSLKIEPRNQATPKRGTLSNEKAKKLIGFSPEWNIEKGYQRYINWYKELKASGMRLTSVTQTNE